MKKDLYLILLVLVCVINVAMVGLIGMRDKEIEKLRNNQCQSETYIYYEDLHESCTCESDTCICKIPNQNQ